jgi:hypothetical protein
VPLPTTYLYYVSIRQHTSAYVSIRQHTSAYVSILAGRGRKDGDGGLRIPAVYTSSLRPHALVAQGRMHQKLKASYSSREAVHAVAPAYLPHTLVA